MATDRLLTVCDYPSSTDECVSESSASSSADPSSRPAFPKTSSSRTSVSSEGGDRLNSIEDDKPQFYESRPSLPLALSTRQLSKIPPTTLLPALRTSVAYLKSISAPNHQSDATLAASEPQAEPLQIYSLHSSMSHSVVSHQDALKSYVYQDNWTKHDFRGTPITDLPFSSEIDESDLLQQDSTQRSREVSEWHDECAIFESLPPEFLTEVVLHFLSILVQLPPVRSRCASSDNVRAIKPSNSSSSRTGKSRKTNPKAKGSTSKKLSMDSRGKKRGNPDEDETEDDESDPSSHSAKKLRTGKTLGPFACQYGKMYRYLLNVRLRQNSCLDKGYANMSALKNHLRREHYLHCPGCPTALADNDTRQHHIDTCPYVNDLNIWTVMRPDQAESIHQRYSTKSENEGTSWPDVDEWYRVKHVLFPDILATVAPWVDISLVDLFHNTLQLAGTEQSSRSLHDYIATRTTSLNSVLPDSLIRLFVTVVIQITFQALLNSDTSQEMQSTAATNLADPTRPPSQPTGLSFASISSGSADLPSLDPNSGTSVTTNLDQRDSFPSASDSVPIGNPIVTQSLDQVVFGMERETEDASDIPFGELVIQNDEVGSKGNEQGYEDGCQYHNSSPSPTYE